MRIRMKRGVSDETLNHMLRASYHHAALAYGTRDEEQIQRQLDDIAMRAAAVMPCNPEPATAAARRTTSADVCGAHHVLDWLLPVTLLMIGATVLVVLSPRDWPIASTLIGASGPAWAALLRVWSVSKRAHDADAAASTCETRSRRTRSRA